MNKLLLIAGLFFSLTPSIWAAPPTLDAEWEAATKAYDKENWDGAIKHFGNVIRLDPNEAGAYRYRAFATLSRHTNGPWYALKGEWHERREAYKQPREDLNRAIALDPTDADTFMARSWCNKALGDWSQAVADADQAAKLDPEYEEFADDMRGTRAYNWVIYGYWTLGLVIIALAGGGFIKQLIRLTKAESEAKKSQ